MALAGRGLRALPRLDVAGGRDGAAARPAPSAASPPARLGSPGRGAGQRVRRPAARARGPLTLAQSINRALADVLAAYPEALVFGEDVGRKGGVYGVTRGLPGRLGAARVFDTLLDEQSILGLALGAGVSGLLPVPEIQYLAYLHNAEDQIRGEAATLQFFSDGAVPQPDGGAGRRLRLPEGLRRALPQRQRGRRAARHPRPGRRLAGPARRRRRDAAHLRWPRPQADGSVCVFLEPIALYHTRDLHERRATAAGWRRTRRRRLGRGPRADRPRAGPTATARDLTIVTFGNGLRDEPAGRAPARRGEGSPRGWSTCAGWRRCRSRTSLREADADRPGAGRRRDPPHRRGVRGGGHRAGRRRVHRRRSPGSPARTASSRSATRRSRCCCPRRPSSTPRSRSSRRRGEASAKGTGQETGAGEGTEPRLSCTGSTRLLTPRCRAGDADPDGQAPGLCQRPRPRPRQPDAAVGGRAGPPWLARQLRHPRAFLPGRCGRRRDAGPDAGRHAGAAAVHRLRPGPLRRLCSWGSSPTPASTSRGWRRISGGTRRRRSATTRPA